MAIPPTTDERSIETLVKIMAQLRAPVGGCPWDVEQDHSSIARYAIEEAYEVVDAIDRKSDDDLRDELGDLLLQVVFHARMAEERGAFDLGDVIASISNKMVRRHPHVFEAPDGRDAASQTAAWEDIKAAERAARAGNRTPSVLDDVPVGLPGLTRAEKLCKRAARVGFAYDSATQVMDKIDEESGEVREALAEGDPAHIEEEVGDLLFTAASLTQFLGLDGEGILRAANKKFDRRFRSVERAVAESGTPFEGHDMASLEAFWQAAKAAE